MKYKVGDKTLLGVILAMTGETNPYVVNCGRNVQNTCFLTEKQIDKIIIKPKRNIDHIIELWESGDWQEANEVATRLGIRLESLHSASIKDLLKPYTEPSKYPKLTPEELKAVKWLVDGGYTAIHVEQANVILHVAETSFIPIAQNLPIINNLFDAKWLTSEPINLKELLDAQEDTK